MTLTILGQGLDLGLELGLWPGLKVGGSSFAAIEEVRISRAKGRRRAEGRKRM